MKNTKLKLFALFVGAVLATVALAGCRDASVEGAYLLRAPQGEKSYSVMFELENPKRPVGDGYFETTAYLKLVGVYLNVRKTDGEDGTCDLRLDRCLEQTKEDEPFGTSMSYYGKADNAAEHVGTWYMPFSIEVTSVLHLETYKFYRLTSERGEIYLDEVVFVGEVLDKQGGTGTGQYALIPVTVHSATPHGEESASRAAQRAKALIDDQPSSVTEVIK